ncbi:MAG: hypothetical protein NVS1B6_15950 [Steroidobacteraceae bacterium]
MIDTVEAADSGYRFMPGVSQYSCGVGALPGFALQRVRFLRVVPLKQGFSKVAEIIKQAGRPLTSFAACELRSPAPFTEEGFKAFNEIYIKTLIEWGVMKDGINPVARSNVCPKLDPKKINIVKLKGGHHFDGDYANLARQILRAARP